MAIQHLALAQARQLSGDNETAIGHADSALSLFESLDQPEPRNRGSALLVRAKAMEPSPNRSRHWNARSNCFEVTGDATRARPVTVHELVGVVAGDRAGALGVLVVAGAVGEEQQRSPQRVQIAVLAGRDREAVVRRDRLGPGPHLGADALDEPRDARGERRRAFEGADDGEDDAFAVDRVPPVVVGHTPDLGSPGETSP